MRERHPHQEQPAQRIQLRHPLRTGIGQLHRSQTPTRLVKDPLKLRRVAAESASSCKQQPGKRGKTKRRTFTEIDENSYAFLTNEMLK
jgi:hypothetical protein